MDGVVGQGQDIIQAPGQKLKHTKVVFELAEIQG
jgi:hypothetical protein